MFYFVNEIITKGEVKVLKAQNVFSSHAANIVVKS